MPKAPLQLRRSTRLKASAAPVSLTEAPPPDTGPVPGSRHRPQKPKNQLQERMKGLDKELAAVDQRLDLLDDLAGTAGSDRALRKLEPQGMPAD